MDTMAQKALCCEKQTGVGQAPRRCKRGFFVKDTKKFTPQVLLRRAILVVLDAALILFSFYFALLLRADGAVEATWWPHNRALLYENLPWITALYLISFLVGGL